MQNSNHEALRSTRHCSLNVGIAAIITCPPTGVTQQRYLHQKRPLQSHLPIRGDLFHCEIGLGQPRCSPPISEWRAPLAAPSGEVGVFHLQQNRRRTLSQFSQLIFGTLAHVVAVIPSERGLQHRGQDVSLLQGSCTSCGLRSSHG